MDGSVWWMCRYAGVRCLMCVCVMQLCDGRCAGSIEISAARSSVRGVRHHDRCCWLMNVCCRPCTDAVAEGM